MKNLIKITLSLLLFICLSKMPYGYYQLVRMMAVIGFSMLAYESNRQADKVPVLIYIGLILLFQPFFKIALGRELWNIVDVIVGIGLLLSIFINRNSLSEKDSASNE